MNNLFEVKQIKMTNQRKLVINTIEELGYNATAKNIFLKCKNKIDKSTIYRILELFLEKGIFEKKLNYENKIYYSLKENHAHYFICICCHKKVKLGVCPLSITSKLLEETKGYKILNHVVQIDGICDDCQKNSTKKAV